MADDYYVASVSNSDQMLSDSANYDRAMKRSTRVLSKFNEEQKKSAFESIKSSMIVVAGAQLIYKGMSSILGKLQASINKFTYAPLMDGLNEYTTQLENFQAIVQNTSQWFDSGDSVGQIEAITGALDELNAYADKTIYKYSDMMSAVTGFTTAGLTIEDSTSIAQGLASLTAYMGKGAQQYASAAYMFNQAIQQGKMQWYQWRSIEQTAGIGGEKTKKLMIETAKSMGKDAPDWDELANIYSSLGGEEADNTFRDSLKDDWLTADVLLESMKILNGEFDDATLKAQGFSDEIIQMSHDAVVAAGQVRTYGQFMDAVVESIGTGWSQIFRALFGDVSVATKMWTNLMNKVTDDIKEIVTDISNEAQVFSDLGGRNNVEKILNNVWTIIKNIGKSLLKVVKIFIPKDENGELKSLGQILYDISESIVKITDVLAGNVEPVTNFQKALSGIGDVISFLFGLIKRLIAVLQKLGAATKPIWDGIMGLVVRLGPQLKTLLENIVGFIEKIADSLIDSGIFQAIGNIFTGASDSIDSGLTKGISGFFITIFESISNALKGVDLDGIFGAIIHLIESFTGMFDESGDNMDSAWKFIKFAIAIWLAVKMLKPVFKDIASIAKSYSGVGNQFWSIMGAVLAVLIAFEMFNQIKMGNILSLWIKMEFLAAVISLLARSITKVSNAAGDAWTLIPLLLFVGGIVAAAVYGLMEAQKAGTDLDQLTEVLKVIATILKSLALLIGTIALLLFAISLKQYIAAKYGKKAMALAQQNQDLIKKLLNRDTWNFNTKNSVNVNFLNTGVQFMLGIAASIASIGFSIKMIADAVTEMGSINRDSMWRGVGATWVIVGMIAVLLAAIIVFSKLQKKNKSSITSNTTLSKALAGKTTTKTVEKSGLGGLIASVIVITEAIKILSDEVIELAKLDPDAMWDGVLAILSLAGIISAMVTGLQFLSKIKTEGIRISTIVTLTVILSALVEFGIEAALLGLVPQENLDRGINALITLATLLMVILIVIQAIGNKGAGIKAATIGALITVAGSMVGLLLAFAAVAFVFTLLAQIPGFEKIKPIIQTMTEAVFLLGVLLGGLAVIATKGKNMNAIFVAAGAMVAVIGAFAILVEEISKLDKNFPYGKIWHMVGAMAVMVVLVGLIAIIIAGLDALMPGSGMAVMVVAAIVIVALAGALLIASEAILNLSSAMEVGANAFTTLIEAFKQLTEMDMWTFVRNLAVLVESLKASMPTISSFAKAMSGFQGTLLFSAGNMAITSGSLSTAAVVTAGEAVAELPAGTISGATEKSGTEKFKEGATNVGKGIGGFVSGILTGAIEDIYNTGVGMAQTFNNYLEDPTGTGGSDSGYYSLATDVSDIKDILTGDYQDAFDMSSLYGGQYYNVVKDMQLNNASMQDVYDAINDVKEDWRNGLIGDSYNDLATALSNALSGMVVNLDGEKVGELVDQISGDRYTSE